LLEQRRDDWLDRNVQMDRLHDEGTLHELEQERNDLQPTSGDLLSGADTDSVGQGSVSSVSSGSGMGSSVDRGSSGGKRRKPATKRKARRSASSKRKQTAAAKRRHTTTKSKRTHHARRRRATRRN